MNETKQLSNGDLIVLTPTENGHITRHRWAYRNGEPYRYYIENDKGCINVINCKYPQYDRMFECCKNIDELTINDVDI